jgi:hypothetical protein
MVKQSMNLLLDSQGTCSNTDLMSEPLLSLTEYRQKEVYWRKGIKASFAKRSEGQDPVFQTLLSAKSSLETEIIAGSDIRNNGATFKQYMELPRNSDSQRIIAEILRILRVISFGINENGIPDLDMRGHFTFFSEVNRVALKLSITRAGLVLINSVIHYYLHRESSACSEAYIDLMMLAYYTDIQSEIKHYNDEDRILYQFRMRTPFNRHFRYDCENIRIEMRDGVCHFDIPDRFTSAEVYPFDFYIIVNSELFIVPREAVINNQIYLHELKQWKARTGGSLQLPAHFAAKFDRETMDSRIPMT